MSEQIIDIDLAKDVKSLISKNPDITFVEATLENKLNDADDWDLLKITKNINSPTIITDIEVINEAILENKMW